MIPMNRRERENLRDILLDCVDAWKAKNPHIHKRTQRLKGKLSAENCLLLEQLLKQTIYIYETYGEEETKRYINAQCDELANLRMDKEGNMNIDADEFVKRIRARVDRGDGNTAPAD